MTDSVTYNPDGRIERLDDNEVKELAPNMGDVDGDDDIQVSGVIAIPARCVVGITSVVDPRLTGGQQDAAAHDG